MTTTNAAPDPTMEAIGKAMVLGREGDIKPARRDLLASWHQIGVAGGTPPPSLTAAERDHLRSALVKITAQLQNESP